MKIKLIGIQEQDYTLENGYSFKGKKLHAVDLDTIPAGQIGNQVINNIKIAEDSQLAAVPLEVGNTYTVYFNQYGKLDTIIPL